MTEDLYSRDASGYIDLVRQSRAETSLMLVGHNPMMEDVALALAAASDPLCEQIRRAGFPTAGLAVIEFDGEFAQVERGQGRFVDFLTPKR